LARNDPRDPRFKPFRVAMYALYLVVVVGFAASVIYSVFSSVMAMSPKRPPQVERVLTLPECIDGAQVLWARLDDERKALTRNVPARNADEAWSRFRVEWLRDLRHLEAECASEAKQRARLRKLFRQLDSVQDMYMTHAIQYAGEIGPAVDELEKTFASLRTAPAQQ
jgi:hypothetical protein